MENELKNKTKKETNQSEEAVDYYETIMKKCSLTSKYDKYLLDKDCDMF
jgi:hypothetical protein